jgi:hypothetical protein
VSSENANACEVIIVLLLNQAKTFRLQVQLCPLPTEGFGFNPRAVNIGFMVD